MPSGRVVNVTVKELRLAESTSASVPTGAISTGVCSVNAVVTSWPAPPAFRSTTGASFTAVTLIVVTAVFEFNVPSLTVTLMERAVVEGASVVFSNWISWRAAAY